MWRPERDQDPWTTGEHLLAVLAETVDFWGRKTTLAHQFKVSPSSLPKPLQIPRPGQERQRTVEKNPDAIKAFFGRIFGR